MFSVLIHLGVCILKIEMPDSSLVSLLSTVDLLLLRKSVYQNVSRNIFRIGRGSAKKLKSDDHHKKNISIFNYTINHYFLLLFQHWNDEFLRWNTSEYGGLTRVIVPPEMIWLPDFGLENRYGHK